MELEMRVMDQFVNEEGSDQERMCWRKIRSALNTGHNQKFDILRDQTIWAVTHYGIVNTDGIINHLRRTLEEIGEVRS